MLDAYKKQHIRHHGVDKGIYLRTDSEMMASFGPLNGWRS